MSKIAEFPASVDPESIQFVNAVKDLVAILDKVELLNLLDKQITELFRPSGWAIYLPAGNKNCCALECGINYRRELDFGEELPLEDLLATTRADLTAKLPLENGTGFIELFEPDTKFVGFRFFAWSEVVAIAMRNSAKYSAVMTMNYMDECTALHNSRYLDKCLQEEVSRSRRYQRAVSVLFIDLDHFKLVNDNYGHLVGTKLLREVGQLLAGALRQSDIACRYGGDEFVVVLPETGGTAALEVANRLLKMLQKHIFLQGITISASIGVATLSSEMSYKDLLRASDRAMYWVKEHGRGFAKS